MNKIILLLLPLCLFGCMKPYNTANLSLEALAEAAAETDELLAENMVEDHEAARAAVLAEAQQAVDEYNACVQAEHDGCGVAPSVDTYMARYLAQVERWEQVTVAFEGLQEALMQAQRVLIRWREAGERPTAWGDICQILAQAANGVIATLVRVDVRVPDAFATAIGYLDEVCNFLPERGE